MVIFVWKEEHLIKVKAEARLYILVTMHVYFNSSSAGLLLLTYYVLDL